MGPLTGIAFIGGYTLVGVFVTADSLLHLVEKSRHVGTVDEGISVGLYWYCSLVLMIETVVVEE